MQLGDTVVISQPMLFPWRGMIEQMLLADVFVVFDDVQFTQPSFTRRVQIKTAAGLRWFTVPIAKWHLGDAIASLATDQREDWRARLLQQFEASYRTAPHFAQAMSVVRSTFDRPDGLLVDLLEDGMLRLYDALDLPRRPRVLRSSAMGVGGAGSARVLAICRALGARRYVTGHGALGYLDHPAFDAAGVSVEYMDYALTPYPQLWGDFTPFVSALDLLANAGPGAKASVAPRVQRWEAFMAARDAAAPGAPARPAGRAAQRT